MSKRKSFFIELKIIGPSRGGGRKLDNTASDNSESLWTAKLKNFYHPNQVLFNWLTGPLLVSSSRRSGLTSLTTREEGKK